ncbi:MAG: hypothetical protein A2Y12_09700 [Planctomycetes bacterium GWF2_42_9]|nr:MAG: hypothetical protein A2Y12_09700 [Planctomycetes bacterium GWF2_42_9]
MPQTQSVYGISGNNIVGCYANTACNGYIYNLATQKWTLLAVPGASQTTAYGIVGNNVVGNYVDPSGHLNGFIYSIPEPCSLILLGMGGLILSRKMN